MSQRVLNEQAMWERECVHRPAAAEEGEFYRGTAFVRQLQGLKSKAALEFACKVTPFFWADAARVEVWLCGTCAAELGLHSVPALE